MKKSILSQRDKVVLSEMHEDEITALDKEIIRKTNEFYKLQSLESGSVTELLRRKYHEISRLKEKLNEMI
jgi:hypothetical protein